MKPTFINLMGWLPAIIIPAATLIQLVTIFKRGSAQGVSWLSWLLFGIANIGLYIYTEKYLAVQTILGLLSTAVLDFIIAGLAIFGYRNRGTPHSRSDGG